MASRSTPEQDDPSDASTSTTSPTSFMSETTVEPKAKRVRSCLTDTDLTDHETLFSMPLSIVIFGATGDLAKKKLFPSLYQLCLQGHLPRDLAIVGYGRSKVERSAFITKQCVNVGNDASWPRDELFERISFHTGGYDAATSYAQLDDELMAYERSHWSGKPGNRLFFLSVPPTVFGTVAEMISSSCRAS